MFAEHQPQLSRLGRSNAAGFERVATFALLTIRQPLRIACMDYRALRRTGENRMLWGWKARSYDAIRARAGELHERCEYIYEACDDDMAADLILGTIAELPGFGPAKAGFVTQMIYGLSGCIDTHNLTRFGLPERIFRGREAKISENRLRQTYRDYNSFCRKVGGTAALWDGWCEYLANRDPINYEHSAEKVSSLHLVPLEC